MLRNKIVRRWAAGSLAKAAAIVAATMAAALMIVSLGSPIASAATRQTTAPAGLTWHPIKLINGWRSAAGSFSTGTPRWAVSHGIVYFAGSMETSSTNQVFAMLPRAARPARGQVIQVYTYAATTGELQISPYGPMVMGGLTNNFEQFTSFAGVSFPARGTDRHSLGLINHWAPGPAGWDAGNPAYSLIDGVVYLSGAMRQPTGNNARFARLPRGLRPSHVQFISIFTGNGSPGELEIDPNGLMYAENADAQQDTSLDGISFSLTSAGTHQLKLLHGWKSSQTAYDSGKPSYAVRNGVVYLSGSLHQATGTDNEIGVLPKGARPAHVLYIITYDVSGSIGDMTINPDGELELYSSPSSNAQQFTSLASISFPAKS